MTCDPLGGTGRVVALSGGIGGAKLALGLRNVLAPGRLHVIANTADDFEQLGLSISPDIDTLLYTLGGQSDTERGWGRADETWSFMAALDKLGGETWFLLGDGDLATHVQRTLLLRAGVTLTELTQDFAARLGTGAAILPMCDAPVRTLLETDEGILAFQHYFVRRRCEPRVKAIAFKGIGEARLSPAVAALLAGPVDAIIVCPSNPFISIEPILAVPGMRAALRATGAPVVVVSPIIGNEAVKGPTAKMFRELGLASSQTDLARRYKDFIDVLVVDERDRDQVPVDIPVVTATTLMVTLEDRERLARTALRAAARAVDWLSNPPRSSSSRPPARTRKRSALDH